MSMTAATALLRCGGRLACAALLVLPAPLQAHPEALPTMRTAGLLATTLSISVPASVNLGSARPGGTINSVHLGSVTVTANSVTSWTATVSSTNFTAGSNTIANGRVSYWSGNATATSGTVGTITPGQVSSTNAQTLDVSRTAFSRTGTKTSHSVTWNPSLIVSVPLTAVAGTYTGTVTHSVA